MFFSDHGGVQWLVVFLGNPGLKYQNTRHNAGFLTADVVEKDCGVHIDRLRFHALTAQTELGGQKVLLMKPQTYMNNSGEAVAPAAKFYKVPPEHILVVSDEIHLQPGRLRIRTKGSAGGHNGLKSIIACLGTDAFPRIRIGIGSTSGDEWKDYVTGQVTEKEAGILAETIRNAAAALECILTDGIDIAMNRLNTSKKHDEEHAEK